MERKLRRRVWSYHLPLLCMFATGMNTASSQKALKYYGVDDIGIGQYAFLKDSLGGNFALVELPCDTLTWKNALSTAEVNGLNLIIWPEGHGHQYTPWAWNDTTWNISEGLEVLNYAERYITSGGDALLAVVMSHEPFYNHGDPFSAAEMKALYAALKAVAPHVDLFVYMNDMAYYDQLLAPLYPWAIEDGIMDIAGIFKHHFGTKHTFAEVLKEINDDYALIQRKGLHMRLLFALQSFATDGIEYRMPSAAEMLEYGTAIIGTQKLDGVFWYPWDRVATSYTSYLSKDRYDSTGADRWSVVSQLSQYLSVSDVNSKEIVPTGFSLSQNYPNPFNPATVVQVGIPLSGVYTVELFNLLGQKVAEVFNGDLAPGVHAMTVRAGKLSSGTYFYTLAGLNVRISRRMTLLR